MLQFFRERLVLLLILLLPFHAAAVTVLTRIFAGRGLPPLAALALWKEVLLLLILCMCVLEWWRVRPRILRFDAADVCIALLAFLSLAVSVYREMPWPSVLLGIRYDLVALGTFFIARRVSWSAWFKDAIIRFLPVLGAVIGVVGILFLFLPASWLAAMGYADLHSLYLPDAPLAPFQQVGGTALRRMQSVMSGPNQLGLWLLLPLSVLLTHTHSRRFFSIFVILSCGILLSFSRAAWIASAVIVAWVFFRQRRRHSMKMYVGMLLILCMGIVIGGLLRPDVVVRVASSKGHIEKPLAALRILVESPLGLGLGSAGPASNRLSDTCVHLPLGADTNWASEHPALCVFAGDIQVQPLNAACHCPLLTENWYLQIGVEAGVLGMLLFIALFFILWRRLADCNHQLALAWRSALLGLGIGALVLHAFEDAAVSYTFFLVAAALLPVRFAPKPVSA